MMQINIAEKKVIALLLTQQQEGLKFAAIDKHHSELIFFSQDPGRSIINSNRSYKVVTACYKRGRIAKGNSPQCLLVVGSAMEVKLSRS